MPNSYHYFESGEVSYERFLLELELLKHFKQMNLLDNLDWKFYDTFALKLFLQSGIDEVRNELLQRHFKRRNHSYHLNFISKCIKKQKYKIFFRDYFQRKQFSFYSLINLIFTLICVLYVVGLFFYQTIKHTNFILDRPLTSKRRHLSLIDDISIILMILSCGILTANIIIRMRTNRKQILFGLILFLIIIIILILKLNRILRFLTFYREIRYPKLYDYMSS